MTLAITFILNSLLNFAFGLLIAKFLGPAAFGIYAVAFSLALLLNSVFTEWTRHSVVRFYLPPAPNMRQTLDWLLLASMLAMAVVGTLAWWLGGGFGLSLWLLLATIAAGMFGGSYDYLQAVARIRRDNRAYARLVALRNGLSIPLVVGIAWQFGDPTLVMSGIAASASLAVVLIWRRLSEAPLRSAAPAVADVSSLARYALPLVAASMLYAIMTFLNRWMMAEWFGSAEAGKFAIAADIGFKLLCSTSTVIELLLLPATIAITEKDGLQAGHKRAALTIVIGLALMAPLTAGYLLTLPAFEHLLVPDAFRDSFRQYTLFLLPSFMALSLAQACFNVLLIIEKKTATAALAGLLAISVNLIGLLALTWWPNPLTIVIAMSAGFAASLAVVAGAALRIKAARPAARDIAIILLATALMLGALWPFRTMGSPWLNLPLLAGAGLTLYASMLLAFNVAGSRGWLLARFR